MLKVLDIDLDFFLDNKYNGEVTSIKRLSKKNYKPWDKVKVEQFLEHNCGLEKSNRTLGRYFIHHDEVFYYLRSLQEKENFGLKFSFDHVDAHGDLGTGDASYKYIATSILSKPLIERAYPDLVNGLEGLSAGNFLSFAVACQWINEIKYVNDIDWADDVQWFIFKDFETESGVIQLKQFSEDQMNTIIYKNIGGMQKTAKSIVPLSYEPPVPFEIIDYNTFKNTDKYDLVFLTQSPGFTPKKSDELISVILKYIEIS